MGEVELLATLGERAYWQGDKCSEMRRPMRVGEFYDKLPQDVKDKLKNLKSDDLRKIRWDAIFWMCHPPLHNPIIAT